MANLKRTRRALVMSSVSLLLCLTMFVGTTYAWFTDSVTSANNIITAGNLDVELYYRSVGQENWTEVTETTNIFKEDTLWEPGHTEVVKLKVVNAGTLAFIYQLSMKIKTEVASINVLGDGFKLSNYIKYTIIEGEHDYTREEAIKAAEENGTTPLNEPHTAELREILPKSSTNDDNEDIFTIVVYLPSDIGNEVNYAKGEKVPNLKFGINVIAIQKTYENDSFGDDYDGGLEDYFYAYDIESLISGVEDGKMIILPHGIETHYNHEALMFAPENNSIYVDGNGSTIVTSGVGTAPGAYDYGYVGFIPAKGNDAVIKNLRVTGSGFVEIGHHDGKKAIGGGDYTVTNLIVEDLVATLSINNCGNNIAAAFSHYGNAVMKDCVMTGTTTEKTGYKPYDIGLLNGTKTTIDGGKYGTMYIANQAHVTIRNAQVDSIDCTAISVNNLGKLTIGAGAKIGVINLVPAGTYNTSLVIEEGAEVGEIIYKGVSYTMEEWMART